MKLGETEASPDAIKRFAERAGRFHEVLLLNSLVSVCFSILARPAYFSICGMVLDKCSQ